MVKYAPGSNDSLVPLANARWWKFSTVKLLIYFRNASPQHWTEHLSHLQISYLYVQKSSFLSHKIALKLKKFLITMTKGLILQRPNPLRLKVNDMDGVSKPILEGLLSYGVDIQELMTTSKSQIDDALNVINKHV